MIIGITQRVVINQFGERQDAIDQRWFQLAKMLQVTLLPIPNVLEDPISYLKTFFVEGVIFSGGNDVAIDSLGLEEQRKLNLAPDRDRTEELILNYVIEKNLPLLGVCRGAQFINVCFKGGLVALNADEHVAKDHQIFWRRNDFIELNEPSFTVNSFHNFGINHHTLSKHCIPLAVTENGEIEAFHHNSAPVLGLLWHPERYTQHTPHDLRIISQFFGL